MGFWSSLVSSAAQVAHFVSNNAGSFKAAARVIANIAGVPVITEEELAEDGGNILPSLKSSLDKAEDTLLAAATAYFPQPTATAGRTLKTIDLPALWPTPTSTQNTKVIPEIVMDINRFLAIERFPVTGGKDGQDIGQQVANHLFNPPANMATALDSDLLYNPVNVSIGKNSSITGGMVFYRIPLGNPGSYKAWHSHLRLYYLSSAEDRATIREENLALVIKQSSISTKPSGSYNSATLSVQWTGSRGVAAIMSKAVGEMLNDNPQIKFNEPAVIDGTRFKYQFSTIIETGPADVAAELSKAIGNALPKPSTDHPQPRMPTIKVSNLQTYIE
ncbi:hypothetical protein EDB81DRAFT_918870 [Dactylonectria macrodidyma]|uniref:Uncharacterized protein n=1 Tax=Dactylonectria macrodidyma TaxID=307937 RepID=A0A9P9JNE0_9HYPO|nr:hypothetical protein EDB81DRAFT_918870 [Dactylonectria macrodidyma]